MPAREDLDPADIPRLLPHVIMVDKVENRIRYRLVGTAIARAFGYDPTGKFVGASLPEQGQSKEAYGVFARVFMTAKPVLATGAFLFTSQTALAMSLLLLPLSPCGVVVDKAISTLVTRHDERTARRGWLKGLAVEVYDVFEIASAEQLRQRCHEWERAVCSHNHRAVGLRYK
jgi:hypothetical protein